MTDLLEKFKTAKQALYEHVGFVEDWVTYPIEDYTDYFWDIDGYYITFFDLKDSNDNQNTKESIEHLYKTNPQELEDCQYSGEIYTQRFYKKWVYVGEDYTMVFLDTRTDGMKYFAFFLNKNRLKLF